MNYLDKQVEGRMPQQRMEDWQPFYTYRNSLMQGEQDWNPLTFKTMTGVKKRRGRPPLQADSKSSVLIDSSFWLFLVVKGDCVVCLKFVFQSSVYSG